MSRVCLFICLSLYLSCALSGILVVSSMSVIAYSLINDESPRMQTPRLLVPYLHGHYNVPRCLWWGTSLLSFTLKDTRTNHMVGWYQMNNAHAQNPYLVASSRWRFGIMHALTSLLTSGVSRAAIPNVMLRGMHSLPKLSSNTTWLHHASTNSTRQTCRAWEGMKKISSW